MIRVGVVFGGQSPEHEVSVISSLQAAAALDSKTFEKVPIYIAKDGTWYTGENLFQIENYADTSTLLRSARRVSVRPASDERLHLLLLPGGSWFQNRAEEIELDILFLGLHGGAGENGGLQGLCETLGVPYTGSGVLASALAMDKGRSKIHCRESGIPVVPFRVLRESEWAGAEEQVLDQLEADFDLPVIVKPLSLGSSIGIALAADREKLDAAIEEAFRYDECIIIEKAVKNLREINCSVLGTPNEARASVLEEPVSASELLSYQEKYMRGRDSGKSGAQKRSGGRPIQAAAGSKSGAEGMASLDRVIPAPVGDEWTAAIQAMACDIFQTLECSGVARIDFLLDGDTNEIYFNEINTIPGSFSFYLWEPAGVPFAELLGRMIEIGFERHRERFSRIRSYDVNLLAERGKQGLKS